MNNKNPGPPETQHPRHIAVAVVILQCLALIVALTQGDAGGSVLAVLLLGLGVLLYVAVVRRRVLLLLAWLAAAFLAVQLCAVHLVVVAAAGGDHALAASMLALLNIGTQFPQKISFTVQAFCFHNLETNQLCKSTSGWWSSRST